MIFYKNYIIIFLLLFFSKSNSLSQTFNWAHSIGNKRPDYGIIKVNVDDKGNAYTTGMFKDTIDIDPGPGVLNLNGNKNVGAFISKFNSAGMFLWAKCIVGFNTNSGVSAVTSDIDDSGNIYITGNFGGTVDFDPGIGTYYLTSSPYSRDYSIKLDSTGNFIWVKYIGDPGSAIVQAQTIDENKNVFFTGYFKGTVDFDPGPGVFNLTNPNIVTYNIYVLKLDSMGNFVWAKGVQNGNHSVGGSGYSITTDILGNVYYSGTFSDTIDFDPGFGIRNLACVPSPHTFISKLDPNGNFLWAKVIDESGHSYVKAHAMAVNNSPTEIYLTGEWYGGQLGVADMDPGSNIFNLVSAGGSDIFILKLDSAGNFIWSKGIGGINHENAYSIDVDSNTNFYISGYFSSSVDFDPGPASKVLTPFALSDIFISKYLPSGNLFWSKKLGNIGNDYSSSVKCGNNNSVYSTGIYYGTVDFDPGIGTYNLTSVDSGDIFILKLQDCNTPTYDGIINGPSTVCVGTTHTFAINHIVAASGYTWSIPVNATIISGHNTNTINVLFDSVFSGNISVTPFNSCDSASTATLSVTVKPLPLVGAIITPSSVICYGDTITLNGTGAIAYTWTGGITNGVPFIPTNSSTYTVIGIDIYGCTDSSIIAVTLKQTPIVGANASPSTSVCPGTSITLTGTGAAFYSWSGGITNGVSFIPTANTTYIVTGTEVNGCIDTASISILIYAPPNVNANVLPSTSVCSGTSVTLTGTGAATYFWTGGVINGTPFIPTGTNTYTVTGINNDSCVATHSITITVTQPLITVNSPMITCGDTANLVASGANSYVWSAGVYSTGINTAFAIPLINTTYSVIGNLSGCLDTATSSVSVIPLNDSISVSGNGNILSANELNATYQWINCENLDSIIPGATNQTYFAISNSTYAVILSNGTCIDTSNCVDLRFVGLTEDNSLNYISIFPNPFNYYATINFNSEQENTTIKIIDLFGQELRKTNFSGNQFLLEKGEFKNGVYIVQITTRNKYIVNIKIIIN